jgi:serine/threonine protein kinase
MATRFFPLDQSDPAEIAGYLLRARLGSGGMGNVYLSFTRGGRPVAIKVVRKEFADDPEFRRRFRQEVTVAQRVQGIYTAPVLDADPDAQMPWLATAYVAGPSLVQAVAEHGPFPEFSVYRLLGGVAEGLSSVHAAGLVHRDLKPANVLLAEDGPRVIDFGIAHAADASALTGTGAMIGTPAFMAPEQVAGRPVSAATDVFALAHLVLYAATGHTAFGDGHFAALVYRIANESPNLDGCPDSLRPLIERSLAKNPAERPDLAEVMEFARQMLSGQTMGLVGASWLPDPVASNLAAYDSRIVPPPPPPAPVPSAAPPGAVPPVTVPSGSAHGPGYTQAAVFAQPSLPQEPVSTAPPGYPRNGGATMPPGQVAYPGGLPQRRRGILRPAVLVPAAAALLLVVGIAAYAAGSTGKGSTPPVATGTQAKTPASPSSASASASALASAASSPSSSPSGATNSNTYSTPEPFPLCDPNGAQWNLVNLTPQSSGGCTQDMQVAANSPGYSFATASAFPHGVPLSANNTVTISGSLPDSAGGYHPRCFGAAEGSATTGYLGLLCNSGQWVIDSIVGLGSHGVIVGKQVASGSVPFTASTPYNVSLAFSSGTGKLTITLTQGSASPLVQSFTAGQFTPVAVGYGLNWVDNNLPINPSDFYPTINGLIYTVG